MEEKSDIQSPVNNNNNNSNLYKRKRTTSDQSTKRPKQDTSEKRKLKIAVLFDGVGLSRLGLEMAGHECTGYELNPIAHYLSKFVGSGNTILSDVRDVDLSGFDAIWASPPCQTRSSARTQGDAIGDYCEDLLEWSLNLKNKYPEKIVWVENVTIQGKEGNDWGIVFNAAQFGETPIQNRNRIIGGRYPLPKVEREYQKTFKGICPCVTASEYKGCATDNRRASRFYGRRLTIHECAYHQGFKIPEEWKKALSGYSQSKWNEEIYRGIGNGVPVYMAKAFGEAISNPSIIVTSNSHKDD
jgi:site-specific DNA-cytosine methylase